MGIIIDIREFQDRRKKRLDARGVRMDYEVGNFPADEPGDGGAKKATGGSTKLPYGLCKAAGIDTTGMTPSEAWAALAGETGIKPKEAYKELKEKGSAKELAKEAKEAVKEKAKEPEVPEEEKLSGSEHLENRNIARKAADRFKAAIDMAPDRETIEKALSGVPTGGVVRFTKIDKHGKISEHTSTAQKNADGTFTTKKGTISAELLSWWLQRDKDNGKKFGLEADDFTMPVSEESKTFSAPKKPEEPPVPEPAPSAGGTEKKTAVKKKASTSPAELVIPAAPAITGAKIPVRTTKEVDIPKLKTVINADARRKEWADKHPEYSPYVEKLNGGIKYLLDTNKFCMNFDAKNIESILKKGFMNQIQTSKDPEIKSKTHGMYSPTTRKEASQMMFGTPKGTKAEDYEKYGYLGNPLDEKTEKKKYASHYGAATVIFKKDRLKNRTTYTYDDSLGEGHSGYALPGKDGDDPSWEGAGYNGISSWTKKPSAMMEAVMNAPSKKTPLSDIVSSYGYIELQYHGDLTMSDVEAIVFRSPMDYSYVTPEVKEALDALGIKIVKQW